MDAIKLLSSLLGNKSLSSGLGGNILSGLLGGGGSSQSSGGLSGLLGSVLGGGSGGGRSSGGGMLSGLLGSVMGGGNSSGGGSLLDSLLGGGSSAAAVPQEHQAEANQQAEIMIRAMINAAKSDGRIDDSEKAKIIEGLGSEVTQAEIDFVQAEFAAPLDAAGFARSVPNGLEAHVYTLSLTSIDLDSQNEAKYLGQLAQGMGMDPQVCNQIHEQVGAPKIFA